MDGKLVSVAVSPLTLPHIWEIFSLKSGPSVLALTTSKHSDITGNLPPPQKIKSIFEI